MMPTEYARSMVGEEVTITITKRGKTTILDGTISAVERMPGVSISTENGTFPAVRFGVRCKDGRLRWSSGFADTGEAPGSDGQEGPT